MPCAHNKGRFFTFTNKGIGRKKFRRNNGSVLGGGEGGGEGWRASWPPAKLIPLRAVAFATQNRERRQETNR
ncbi:hypothetical protein DdX_16796 [Ditylenchus destructor]|uniref:Uncharacterized protein n=1 Tax=Ditylenchus destructor TaxID=166010 RepID=A0AAD4QZL7_9BILA|nr:hypothetical protein DdX_16796 [Ditylenchus destructor]